MLILIIIFGLIIDRLTKIWAINVLSGVSEITIIKNFFSFLYIENKGAAFGIFQNKTVFLTIITVIIMIGIVYYIVRYKPRNIFVNVALSLIISGALGNLIDRIYYRYVVDFISLHYKEVYYFPVFNVADIMVVLGTIILVFCLLREDKNGN
ncbi:signal peptidase II [Clostridium algifaecis]|uniref:Lipoprotein signal peptidase n=1 Tax=Clostridium algifaecis TaxID=1472040 RepID=A0ABS4KN36_9CLOT|nr:signal peptidase II [Clostridium algifaecis]MBP2031447.1 signal peptidase II [Clostridium algifaecis]